MGLPRERTCLESEGMWRNLSSVPELAAAASEANSVTSVPHVCSLLCFSRVCWGWRGSQLTWGWEAGRSAPHTYFI